MRAQVRVREHERDVPLYVMIRKWVQNDPETELMQAPGPDPPKPAGEPQPGAQPPAVPENGAGEPTEDPEQDEAEPKEGAGNAAQRAAPPARAPLPQTQRDPSPTEVTPLSLTYSIKGMGLRRGRPVPCYGCFGESSPVGVLAWWSWSWAENRTLLS